MTTDQLLSVAYSSEATRSYSDDELQELLESSRSRNASVAVTGMLIYRDGRFLQVVEGPESVVRDLLARIVKDTRHENVRFLLSEHVHRRSFTEWTMGYRAVRADPRSVPRGFRSTFDDLQDNDNSVVQRALGELTIWFRAHRERNASDRSV